MLLGIAIVAMLTTLPVLAGTALAYAACRGQRGDTGTEPLHAVGTVRAFLREWLATLALVAAAPFRLRRGLSEAPVRGIVIVIPELRCSSAGFWYLRRRLRAAGWTSVAGLDRFTNDPAADAIAALDARIAGLPPGADLVLVGHGAGGLLAREYAAARPDLRLRHVVTLGTAHQGTRGLPYSLLGATPRPALNRGASDLIAIFSDFDAWLVPVDDAYCPQGFNIAVRGLGHCAMLLSRQVADLIAENLAAPVPKR
jgi:pimeloyl-ACP methyl ester carboxylesterase